MLSTQLQNDAMETIVNALRAMGPLTVTELWHELLAQCQGVHALNVDRVRQAALSELRQRNVIRRYSDDGSAWEIHPRMYDADDKWDSSINYKL